MNEVKTRSVPQIKGLRVEYFIYFIENETNSGVDYLPENYKEINLNRQWLANICNIIIYDSLGNTLENKFKLMINTAIKEREELILKKNSMKIHTDTIIFTWVDIQYNNCYVK